jgi:tetratricopeptide (TPR) repeat protein
MKKIILLSLLILPLFAFGGIREGRNAYLQSDMQKYFTSLVDSVVSSPQSARSAVICDYFDDLRGTVTNYPSVTNAYRILMLEASNRIVRFAARQEMAAILFRMGQPERASGLLRQNGLITGWKVFGPFIDAGRSDLDTVFPFERNSFHPDLQLSNSSGPVIAQDIGPFTPEGWVAPFYSYGYKQGVVYMVSWFQVARDGPYRLGLSTDESCDVFLDSGKPVRLNGFTHDPGRNAWYSMMLSGGWHRIVIKMLKTTSFPAVGVCVVDGNWSIPEGFSFTREAHPVPLSPVELKQTMVFPETWFKNRIDSFKADADDRFWYGLSLLKSGREDDFVRQFNEAVNLDSKNIFYKVFFAAICITRNEYPNSSRIEKALSWLRSPSITGFPIARTLVGLNQSLNKMTRDAGKTLRTVCESSPGNFSAWHFLAELSLRQKWDEEFLRYEDKVLQLNPYFIPAIERMMRFWQSRDPGSAFAWADRLSKQDALSFSAAGRPALLIDAGRLEEAEKLAGRLLAVFPEMKELHFYRAEAMLRLGRTNEAGKIWDAVAAKYPQLPEALQKAGDFFLLTGKTAKGLSLLKKSLVIDPSDIATADKVAIHETGMLFSLEGFMDARKQASLVANALKRTDPSMSGSVICDDEEVMKVNPDGTWHSLVYQVIRVTGKDGIAKWGNSSIDNYPRMRILKARTYLQNGEIIDVSQVQKQGSKRVLTFPVLEENSVIELEYLTTGSWNRIPGTGYFYSYPQILQSMEDDILNGIYKVVLPRGRPFSLVTRNFSGRQNITVSTENFPDSTVVTVRSHDSPGIPKESSLPPVGDMAPTFQVVIFPGDASLLGRWYRGLTGSEAMHSPELDSKLLELSENRDMKNSGLRLIHTVYDWLQSSVLASDSGLYSPDNPRRILDSRSGSVENKTLLMKFFLERLGISSVPVLVRTTDLSQADFSRPNPSLFNDILLRVDLSGSFTWLDFSNKFFPFGHIGWDKYGAQGFDTEASSLLTVPVFSSASNRAEYENVVTFPDPDRRLHLRCRRTWTGGARVYEELFDDPGTRESMVHQFENRSLKGLSISNIIFSSSEDRNSFGYSFETDPGPMIDTLDDGLHLPLIGIRAKLVETFISGKERRQPFKIYTPVNYVQELKIIGAGKKLIHHPDDVDLQTPFGSYSVRYTEEKNGILSVRIMIDISPQTINVKDYPAFLDFCQKVDDTEKEEIVISR